MISNRHRRWAGSLLIAGAAVLIAADSGPVIVGEFAASGSVPAPWRTVRLNKAIPPTRYRLVEFRGSGAVEASAVKSMALLARPIRVDLADTPMLCWRWSVDAPVAKADMARKSGDDYAARVYVAFDMPNSALSRGTRFKLNIARRLFGASVPDAAITYVWDNRHAVGTRQASAYTDRAQLIVAETGSAGAGRWVSERTDVAADFARAFENAPGTPVQLAIASDADNTKGQARAHFADIHFVGRGRACRF